MASLEHGRRIAFTPPQGFIWGMSGEHGTARAILRHHVASRPHIVFRFVDVRQRWIILAPERLLLPDEQAVEILQLVDGKTSAVAIIDTLAGRYTQAPRDLIARVTAMLQDLADKGCLADDSSN